MTLHRCIPCLSKNAGLPAAWLTRISLILILSTLLIPSGAFAAGQSNGDLETGIADYKAENYEEAVVSLKKALKADPSSASAAYYLGLAYKGVLRYADAKEYLEKALSLDPSLADAYVELAEACYGLSMYDEAEGALKKADELKVRPAQTAYLRGRVRLKKKDYDGAISRFRMSSDFDASYKQRAAYFTGLAYAGKGMADDAKASFKEAMAIEPGSIVAANAKKGLESIESIKPVEPEKAAKRPWKLAFGYSFQYDDNVLLKPTDEIAGVTITGEEGFRHVFTFKGDYTTERSGPVNLKALYSYYQSIRDDFGSLDIQAHKLQLTPVITAGQGQVELNASYNIYLLDNEPYLNAAEFKPAYRLRINDRSGVIMFAGWVNRDFVKMPVNDNENRDGVNLSAGISYYALNVKKDSLFSLGYAFDKDGTEGDNWDYRGHKATVQAVCPLKGPLEARLTASYYRQDYESEHTSYGKKRKDHTFTVAPDLVYKINNAALKFQYSFTRGDSSIAVYDYTRNIVGIGAEYTY